ncbi:MAG: PQQ-binding-like beta-propeller repeat protein [Candidatus Altiarchaeota archaeon]
MRKILLVLALFALAQSVSSHDWPTFRGNYQRNGVSTAYSKYSLNDIQLLWNYSTGKPVRSSPAIADINNDTILEVVFGSDNGRLYALDYSGRLLWKFATGAPVRSSPTLADVDGDGKTDVVFGSDDGNLYVLDNNGRLMWNYTTHGVVRGSPAVMDLGGTPAKEVVFGSYDGAVYCLNHPGIRVWEYQTLDSIASSPALFDVDHTGGADVIIGSNDNMVYILKHPPYKSWSYAVDGDISATPAIANTGYVYVGSEDRKIYRLTIEATDATETRRVRTAAGWTTESIGTTGMSAVNYTSWGAVTSSAALSSLDDSGVAYVIFGSADGTLYFMHTNLTLVKRYTLTEPIESSPALADLNRDNVTDVIFGSDDGVVYVINYPGTRKFSYRTGGKVKSSPAVADLTNDGALEFAVGSDDGRLYMFGDMRRVRIAFGDVSYRAALRNRDVGDMESAKENIAAARSVYSKISYPDGIVKCDNLLRSLDADLVFNRAEGLYIDANLTEAGRRLDEASRIYGDVNDTAGIRKSQLLYQKIEAEKYLLEAQYYYSIGLTENASTYLAAAARFYRGVNDTQSLIKLRNASDMFSLTEKADKYYADGLKAIGEGKPDNALMIFGFARQSYELAGNNAGLEKTERMLTKIKADTYYQKALEYYNEGDYIKASDQLKQAIPLYQKTGGENAEKAITMYDSTKSLVEADILYVRAQQSYDNMSFDEALEYSGKSMSAFNTSGDATGYRKAQRLYMQAEDGKKTFSTSSSWLTSQNIAIALSLAAVAYLLLRRPSTEPKKKIVLNVTGLKEKFFGRKPKPVEDGKALESKKQLTLQQAIAKELERLTNVTRFGLKQRTVILPKLEKRAVEAGPLVKPWKKKIETKILQAPADPQPPLVKKAEQVKNQVTGILGIRKRPKVILVPRQNK